MRSLVSRVRPVHVVVALLLLVAMGSSATAGAMITGKQVRDGSLTGKDIKDRSIKARDLAKGLAGRPGPAGPAGVQGLQGVPGPTGAAGGTAPGSVTADALAPIPVVRATEPLVNCDAGSSMEVPSGVSVELRWAAELFDTAGMHSTYTEDCDASHRLVAPRDGVYLVTAGVQWPAAEDTAARTILIRSMGRSAQAMETQANLPNAKHHQSVSTLVQLGAGESAEIAIVQSSPRVLNLENTSATQATMQFVSSLPPGSFPPRHPHS